MTFRIDSHITHQTLAAVSRSQAVARPTRQKANRLRKLARQNAPKRTGAGARSISVIRWYDQRTQMVAFRVSWDRRHFYMLFPEVGTNKISARRFLQRAAEQVQNEQE
jgi:HK97 gp10 family phage protein